MNRLRTLIVDDEPLAREKIRQLVAEEADVDLLAECGDGTEAVEAIRTHAPDLIFLDIRMPGLDGFEVLEALSAAPLPAVVFVTAYDEYALAAFEVHASDYLLKPIRKERLAAALERVRRQRASGRSEELQERLHDLLDTLRARKRFPRRLGVRSSGRVLFIEVGRIDWIDGAGNYVRVHMGGKVHLLRHTLAGLAAKLDPERFLRIHRSTIVNIDRVIEISPQPGGEMTLLLDCGQRLTVSRTQRGRFQHLLGKARTA